MDRKELEALFDEHFEAPLQGERLEALDRALNQDPDLRHEFEAYHLIVETLRTLKAPPVPASLRERILAQARAEAKGETVSIAAASESPKRKATIFSVVRTVCSRWQVQTLAAACLAVALFYHMLPQLNPSLRQDGLRDKLAYSPQKETTPQASRTLSVSESKDKAAEDGNTPVQTAGDYFFAPPPAPGDGPEIAPSIPLLTESVTPETLKAGVAATGSSKELGKTDAADAQPAPELPQEGAPSVPPRDASALGVNFAEPIEALEMLSGKRANLEKPASQTQKTETLSGAAGGASRDEKAAKPKAKDSDDENRLGYAPAAAPVAKPAAAPTPLSAARNIQPESAKAQDETARQSGAKEESAKDMERISTPTPPPTPSSQLKISEKTGTSPVDRLFPLDEKKSRDSKTPPPSAAAPTRAAGTAGAAVSEKKDTLHLSLPRERTTAREGASVFRTPTGKDPEKGIPPVTAKDGGASVKPEEKPQTPAPQKRATPQLARQLIDQSEANKPKASPTTVAGSPVTKEKETIAADIAQSVRPPATPLPSKTGQPPQPTTLGDIVKQADRDDSSNAANKARKKEPTPRSVSGRPEAPQVKKTSEAPVQSKAKQARSGSVSLVVSVQVGTGVSLEDVASLFRGGATISQSAGLGKTLGTLTCTAPGKNQQWVLDQLRGGGIQAKATPGAKGSYQVSQSGSSSNDESSFVFKITVTRR